MWEGMFRPSLSSLPQDKRRKILAAREKQVEETRANSAELRAQRQTPPALFPSECRPPAQGIPPAQLKQRPAFFFPLLETSGETPPQLISAKLSCLFSVAAIKAAAAAAARSQEPTGSLGGQFRVAAAAPPPAASAAAAAAKLRRRGRGRVRRPRPATAGGVEAAAAAATAAVSQRDSRPTASKASPRTSSLTVVFLKQLVPGNVKEQLNMIFPTFLKSQAYQNCVFLLQVYHTCERPFQPHYLQQQQQQQQQSKKKVTIVEDNNTESSV